MGGGKAIDIQLAGPNIDELREVCGEVKDKLSEYPGVIDIADSFRGGKPEVKLAITSEAESLGLTLQDLGRQVRQGFFGEEAQRIQRGRDDIRVMVRYPEQQRRSLGDLESMRVRTPDGGEVPFSTVAKRQVRPRLRHHHARRPPARHQRHRGGRRGRGQRQRSARRSARLVFCPN